MERTIQIVILVPFGVFAVPVGFLLIMQRSDIRRITLDVYKGDIVIPIAGVHEAYALDFDLSEERIYWSDTGQQKDIKTAHVNGTGMKTVIRHGLEMPVSISVDWIAKNIYWSDFSAHRIEVSKLNGDHRRVLIWENIQGPSALAVNPHNGYEIRLLRPHSPSASFIIHLLLHSPLPALTDLCPL